MKNWLKQVGVITGMMAAEILLQPADTTTADAVKTGYYVCQEQSLAGPVQNFASSLEISKEVARWKEANAIEKEQLRLQQERKKQKQCLKKKKRLLRREKIQRERKLRKKKEVQRRKEIRRVCGTVIGSEEEKILYRIVEAEAGGEDIEGRMLVANVILNRVLHKHFPNSIKGVVFAHGGNTYQFSPVSNGSYYRVRVSEGTKKAVQAALQGKDTSQGALYFMERALADRGNASWFDRCLTKLFRHGCHEFYK